MQPLFVAPFALTLAILAALFTCMVGATFMLSRVFPVLISDAHPKSQWLDGLRGMAAVLVALNHAPFVLVNALIIPKVFYFPLSLGPLFNLLGAVGVQIFFCITGALFASKIMFAESIDWSDFFVKRVRRIFPAYFVAGFLALLVAWWVTETVPIVWPLLPAVFSFGLMPLPTINGFEMARVLGVNWSLAIEWRFYMVLPIIFAFSRRYPIAVLGALTAFAVGDVALTQSSAWSFFVIGAVGSLLVKRQFEGWPRWVAHVVALAAVAALSIHWKEVPNYGFQRWVTMAILFTALAVARPKALTWKPLVAMGTVSYSFYLLHAMTLFMLIAGFNRYVVDVGTLGVRNYTVLTGAALILAATLASASYLLVERRFIRKTLRLPVEPPTSIAAEPLGG